MIHPFQLTEVSHPLETGKRKMNFKLLTTSLFLTLLGMIPALSYGSAEEMELECRHNRAHAVDGDYKVICAANYRHYNSGALQ